jgi:hypothetical protein
MLKTLDTLTLLVKSIKRFLFVKYSFPQNSGYWASMEKYYWRQRAKTDISNHFRTRSHFQTFITITFYSAERMVL